MIRVKLAERTAASHAALSCIRGWVAELRTEPHVLLDMRTIRALIVLVAGLTAMWATPGASAKARKPTPRCAAPKGWRVVARDSKVVIVGHLAVEDQWRYCLRGTGRFRPLVRTDPTDSTYSGPPDAIWSLQLSGVYVAWIAEWEYHGTNPDFQIYLRNLVTGRSARTDLGDTNGGDACPPPAGSIFMLLSPAGIASWQVDTCSFSPDQQHHPSSAIQALNDGTGKSTTLDSAPTGELANLELQRCLAGCTPIGATIAWWTHDGVWRSASIG